jgi:hypothetical protein
MKTWILNLSITGKLVVSFTLQLLSPREKNPRDPLDNMLERTQIPFASWESNPIIQPTARLSQFIT